MNARHLSCSLDHFGARKQTFSLIIPFEYISMTHDDFDQGHLTDRIGEYLFGRPIIAYDFRIKG